MEEEFDIVIEQEETPDLTPEMYADFLKGEKGDKGDKGDTGPANTLSIGTVEKGEYPEATITGTSPNQTLNLVLPKGDKGDAGEKGADGQDGQDGYTPVKGVDYFTAADIAGIESDILAQVNEFEVAVVQTLPVQDIDTHTIYFVPKQTTGQNDVYDEYIYINNAWEHIGSTEVDLSNYYNKAETDTLLSGKQETLVSGTNIKTINNTSVLGNGNIQIDGNEVYISDDDTNIPESAKIFIDESEGTDAYSEVVNSLSGNEIAKAPSVRAVNEGLLDVYSTDEIRIGTWINGKPLYRRVLQATFDQHTTYYYHDFSVSDISKIIKYEGFIDAVNQAPMIFSQSEGNQFTLYFTSNNRIRVYSSTSAYSGIAFYLIITYTKTTDV